MLLCVPYIAGVFNYFPVSKREVTIKWQLFWVFELHT